MFLLLIILQISGINRFVLLVPRNEEFTLKISLRLVASKLGFLTKIVTETTS